MAYTPYSDGDGQSLHESFPPNTSQDSRPVMNSRRLIDALVDAFGSGVSQSRQIIRYFMLFEGGSLNSIVS